MTPAGAITPGARGVTVIGSRRDGGRGEGAPQYTGDVIRTAFTLAAALCLLLLIPVGVAWRRSHVMQHQVAPWKTDFGELQLVLTEGRAVLVDVPPPSPFTSSGVPVIDRGRAPLWLVAAVLLITPAAWLLTLPAHRRRTRRPAGLCERCGYNLTGCTSQACPECGRSIGESQG